VAAKKANTSGSELVHFVTKTAPHLGVISQQFSLMLGAEVADFENMGPGAGDGSGGSIDYQSCYAQTPMNTALVDHYRCPDDYVDLKLTGQLSDDAGYFRFGQDTICYGRSASGFRATRPEAVLYDVLNDVTTDGSSVLLPFDPTDVIDNFRLERYAKRFSPSALNQWRQSLRAAYYFLRPYMHVNIRKHVQRAHLNGWRDLVFPRWPVDTTVEDLNEQLLLWSIKGKGVNRIPFVWFWPDGAQSCVVMGHDVEEEKGQNFCAELMNLNDSFGIPASFQLVPEGCYEVSATVVQAIRDRGFEVNIQDLNHDGHLFRDKEEFLRRAQRINRYGEFYGARGFRSAVLYRNQDWFGALNFSFDMSVPNVAHLDPQRGGCCSVMPYFVGDILEIPLTTTQDYMLFHLLNDYSLDLWRMQTEAIMRKNGLVSFLIHPDYIIEKRARGVYRDLLTFLRQLGSKARLWFALPGEVDQWWRERSKLRVIERDGRWRIEGVGAERAQLAFARDNGDHIEYEFDTQATFSG
jgi:hypothetical protein